MKVYPDRQVISMDYPSKFNNYHYAFYLGAENDDDPAMFLGLTCMSILVMIDFLLKQFHGILQV